MKVRFLTLGLLLSVAIPGICAAEPLKLTVDQAWQMLNGLKALDGYQDKLKDGERVTSIVSAYKFGPGFRWAVAKNEAALQPVIDVYLKAARAQQADKSEAAKAEQAEATAKMASETQTVDMVRLKQAEFNLDKNDIPPSVLASLALIVDP